MESNSRLIKNAVAIWPVTGQGFQNTKGAIHSTKIPTGPTGKGEAQSIQPQFPEISVQNSMDRFDSTGKVSVLYKSIGNLVAGHCSGATVGSEQQHNQDLKEIYKGRRILEFITFPTMHCI